MTAPGGKAWSDVAGTALAILIVIVVLYLVGLGLVALTRWVL